MQEIYSHEAEQGYLCGLLIDPLQIELHPLQPDDFFIHKHRFIYEAMLACQKEYGVCNDITLIAEALKKANHYGEVGREAGIVELTGIEASSLNTGAYASEIRKKAQDRAFAAIGQKLYQSAHKGTVNASEVIDQITKAVRVQSHFSDLEELAQRYDAWVLERQANPSDVWGIPTPFKDFNYITGGLHRHEAVMFYGDSNTGKTTLVLQLGYYAAIQGYKVDFYELEMLDLNIFDRMVAMHSDISPRLMKEGKLNDVQLAKNQAASQYIRTLPIRISDMTSWTSMEIRADQVRKGTGKADMVIVDYLALLEDKADTDWQKVEIAAKTLRKMAKDLGQCVITVSSDVKDGSIKGAKEVKFAQDEIWMIKKNSESLTDRERVFSPTKRRNDGRLGRFNLVLLPDLPKFGTVYKGQEEEEPLPYYQK